MPRPAETRHPYSIRFEDRNGYLSARVDGVEDSVATSLAYWKEIAAEAVDRGARRVLVVENFETPVSLLEVYQVAEALPSLIRGLVVAFVDERFEEFEANRFGEDVAVNRGAVGKVFSKESTATEWLLSQ